jgi:hypothetical protein
MLSSAARVAGQDSDLAMFALLVLSMLQKYVITSNHKATLSHSLSLP